MWTVFSISLGRHRTEFSLRGMADVGHNTAKFQGLVNGIVFVEGMDYEKVRLALMNAVDLNRTDRSGLQ